MRLSRVLKISRPRFWLYEAGTYLAGAAAAYAISDGSIYSFLSLPLIAFFVYFVFPANLFIYGINDIYDYETDKLNPKKTEYEALVTPAEHPHLWRWIFLTSIPFIPFMYGASMHAVAAFGIFLLCAAQYSALPIRAKAVPVLDAAFSAGHYVATGVFAYLIAGGENLSATPIIAAMAWAMAMHAYSAVPDIHADRDAGLRTIATLFRKSGTIILCALLYALAAALSWPYLGWIALVLGAAYLAMMVASLNASDTRLFSLYRIFPLLNTVSGMALFFAILLR